jgi:phage repressor protein C with HTH and peptisase S24 domain
MVMSDFSERFRQMRESLGLTQERLAEKLEVSDQLISAYENDRSNVSFKNLLRLADEFKISIDWLLYGDGSQFRTSKSEEITHRDVRGLVVPTDKMPEFALVPIHSQRVSAGAGQESLDDEIIGWLPVPVRMFRGESYQNARACVVRGDSMTGIMMMDGDYVIFNVGVVQGNGVYVLRVGDELLVKRIDFDHFKKRLIITSENPRYPERVELVEDDMDNVMIVGKVFGWTHVHPY